MDTTARAGAPATVPEDDPWATLAVPEAPALPVPGGVEVPTMPWDATTADDGAGPVGSVLAESVLVESPVPEPVPVDSPHAVVAPARGPGPVPTAVAASAPLVSFPPGVASQLAVYVYLLVDARTGRPFLVARGRGDRCFRHVEAARSGAPDGGPAAGKPGKYAALDRIREAESDGRPVRIEVLRHGLTSAEADLVVAAVDDALALGGTPMLGSQRGSAVELGASLAKRAKVKRSHPAVLLRVGPHGTEVTYDSARHGWRIGRRWVDTASERSPRWAVLVSGDLVHSVYRIDRWDPAPTSGGAGARGVERWSFVGTPDADLGARYVGRSVAAYLGTGTPSQVTYVWCGPHWVNTAQ